MIWTAIVLIVLVIGIAWAVAEGYIDSYLDYLDKNEEI